MNRGFGGSRLSDLLAFTEVLVLRHRPRLAPWPLDRMGFDGGRDARQGGKGSGGETWRTPVTVLFFRRFCFVLGVVVCCIHVLGFIWGSYRLCVFNMYCHTYIYIYIYVWTLAE